MNRYAKTVAVGGLMVAGLFGTQSAAFAGPLNTGPGPDIICSTSGSSFSCHNWGAAKGGVDVGYTCPNGGGVDKGAFYVGAGATWASNFTNGQWGLLACSYPQAYAQPL